VKNILLWPLLILSDTSAQLLLKQGAMQASYAGWLPNAFILAGYGLYILSFAIWMQLLKDTRLFIALSGASVVYITVVCASSALLGEPMTGQVIAGTLFISFGVFLIGFGRQQQ